jgi:DNA-binding SARP family transcriptional activator
VLTLRVRFLGTLEIRYDARQLSKPPTRKSQSLLAYLICRRYQPQPRERLAGLFWSDRPELKARHSLATAVWHIRCCLPNEEYILSDAHAIQFDPQADLWLDVDRFEFGIRSHDVASLQSAAALYRGSFLDGFYDDWIINERYRLETLFSDALARLMAGHEARGEDEAALTAALRLLDHDPLREDAYRLAMRAYCRLGQRNAALEQYRRCQYTVRAELGVEPMIETTGLYQAILEGRFEVGRAPEVRPAQVPAVELLVSPGRSPLDAMIPSRLIGREEELGFLDQCWQVTEARQGRLVLISGEAGVGKSRLVEEFANCLRWRGARVLWGRCYEFERVLPYQPVTEALRTILPTLTPTELEDLPTWTVAEVARLVPEVAEHFPGLEISVSMHSDQELTRLFDAVARLLNQLSSYETLLVVVEDLHWASESTLQMLHYLARHLAAYHILLLGTLRKEAVGQRHPLLAFQRQLSQEGLAQLLHLPRLSSEALEAIVIEMSGAGEAVVPLARRLYQETEGNPFFAMEIVKSLFEMEAVSLESGAWKGDFARISEGELPLPASLSEAVQARARSLNDDAQEALRLAAVLGREFDFDLLTAVWDRGEEATLGALDEMLRHRLIDEGSGPMGCDYGFTHHKIQEVVYAGMPRRRLRLLHRRVGEAMEKLQLDDAVALAWHFERAEEPGRAARYALQAGLAAKGVFAHAEAGAYFDRVLVFLEQEAACLRDPEAVVTNQRLRIKALDERGWGLRLLGDMEAYERDLQEVERLARLLGDQRTLAHLRYREAYTHRWFCRYVEAREAAEEGLRLSQAAAAPSLEALCWREGGMAARATGDYDRARAALERALGLFVDLDDAVYEIHTLGNLSTLYWYLGEHEQAMDLARQALARCDEAGLPLQRRLALGDVGVAAGAAGDVGLARRCLLESLSIARQIADRTQEIFDLGHLGWLCVREKQAAQALEHLEAALALAESINSCTEQSWLHSGLAEAHRLVSDPSTSSGQALDQAVAHARRALELAQASGQAYGERLARRILDRLGKADL